MDMLKVLKIRSIENFDYTPQYNRMRFQIPADNLNTHLDESYLSFQVQPKQANGTNIDPTNNYGFGNATDKLPYYPTCLLKVARLFSGDSNIPLEEINKFNLLDINMKIYQKDLENMASDQYESGFFVDDLFQADKSPFYLEGSADIHIPLKDIFGLCKNKDFYLSTTGGLQIEFELEDQYSLFVQNSNSKVAQRVYTSFDTPQSVTPFSTLNNKYISSTQSITPVPLDASELLSNQELVAGAIRENFYINISNAVFDAANYDAVNKRMPVTLTIALTGRTIFDSTVPYQAFGIGTPAGSNILAGSNWQYMPMSLVYKYVDSDDQPLVARELQNLTATFTPFSAPATNATITATLPWINNIAPGGIFIKAVAMGNKLGLASSNLFNQLALTNTLGGIVPTSYANIGGTFEQICAGAGTPSALTLQLGTFTDANTFTYPNLTVSSGALGSRNFQTGAYYIIIMQEINANTTQWQPLEKTANRNINNPVYLRFIKPGTNRAKPFILRALSATELTFGKALSDKDDLTNISFINATLRAKILTPNVVGEIFIQQFIQAPAPGVELEDIEQATLTYSIPRAELVLVQESKKSSDNISNVYMTWKMEPTLIENTTSYWQKQFILEPNVASVCLVYPPQFTNNSVSMYSQDSSLERYRWALDNIDNTNRDVDVNEALHNDKLIDWFNNTNMKLKSLPGSELLPSNSSLIPMKIYTAVDNENMYMDNKNHTLQVVLKSADGTTFSPKNLFLFKQVLKTL